MSKQLTFLFIANYVKGAAFLEECKTHGINTVVVSKAELKGERWPDTIDELFFVKSLDETDELIRAISYLARTREFDAVVPLDDYAVEVAAQMREHLRSPGMGVTTAHYFRDKLAMRMQAQEAGLNVPEFVHVLNNQRMADYMERVPGPWMIKPRSEAGSVQIKKCHTPEEVWEWVEQLGDRRSHFLMEAYVKGQVFHVDSVVFGDKVKYAAPHRYWNPPFDVWNGGGIFQSQSVADFDGVHDDLLKQNEAVIKAMGLPYGVTHAEFIQSEADGKLYFLELAARPGGAHIDHLVRAQSGIDLWQEWARVQIAQVQSKKYKLKVPKKTKHGGILLCLSRQAEPDLGLFPDSEVFWKMGEDYHVGVVIRSDNYDRVTELMSEYQQRIEDDVLAVRPPTAKPA